MDNAVTIKGTKSGIILVLDNSMPFDELSVAIGSKFKEAASFLGKHKMGLIIRGRILSEDEISKVVSLIEENSSLTINCVIGENPGLDEYLKNAMEKKDDEDTAVKAPEPEKQEIIPAEFADSAYIYRGNVRSGQELKSKKSVIVLGDVKPGAILESEGSVFVLGELRGNACAGTAGDSKAIIMALDFEPIQVSIAGIKAVSPDAEKGDKLKVKKKKLFGGDNKEPQAAYIEKGHIVQTAYGVSFLRTFFGITK